MATDYIKNAQEYYDGTATADDLGVKALDDKTLEITLIQPTSYFIDILSMFRRPPLKPTATSGPPKQIPISATAPSRSPA
jgi:oligopeptide transport system substrate-binding protein